MSAGDLPRLAIPPAGRGWEGAVVVPHLVLADGGGPARLGTEVRLLWDERALHVRFSCLDTDIWGTFRERDDPIWQEEVVEVFLAPGPDDPPRYFELEVSPHGVLFDAIIENPDSRRDTMKILTGWNCVGIGWGAAADTAAGRWEAWLDIPWSGMLGADVCVPRTWRGNLYRIERPRGGEAEFSCWSPTLTDPPEFHRPARFGILELTQG